MILLYQETIKQWLQRWQIIKQQQYNYAGKVAVKNAQTAVITMGQSFVSSSYVIWRWRIYWRSICIYRKCNNSTNCSNIFKFNTTYTSALNDSIMAKPRVTYETSGDFLRPPQNIDFAGQKRKHSWVYADDSKVRPNELVLYATGGRHG